MKKKILSLVLTLSVVMSLMIPASLASSNDVYVYADEDELKVGEETTVWVDVDEDVDVDSYYWKYSGDGEISIEDDESDETTIEALEEGTVTLTCIVTDEDGETYRDSVTIEITEGDLTAVSVSPSSVTLDEGDTKKLTATIEGSCDEEDVYFNWCSNDSTVATASASGYGHYYVTVKANSSGYCKVCCEAEYNGKTVYGYCEINVTDASPSSPAISVGSSLVKAGKQVVLPVSIQNNSGIAGYALSLSIPEPLTLTAVTMGQLPTDAELGTLTWNEENNYILWTSGENLYGDGELLLLTLQAPETCSPGMYTIGLSTPEGQTIPFSDDADNALTVSLTAGTLEVCDYTLGDIDNDGDLTAADAVAQALHIVEKRILTGSALLAADLDRDGVVTVKDAVKLLQWLDKGVEP